MTARVRIPAAEKQFVSICSLAFAESVPLTVGPADPRATSTWIPVHWNPCGVEVQP